ncbi:unnamed protein product [Litomosoides sigmodontis]|uniref:PNPLA domain-containing protein n=1 Tax=Litomosoides sigmodontis TaxID=42156 RepID=A0A3P6SHA8_LITSI|nr:unnamed protein product [Litomosoides sigmodontis]
MCANNVRVTNADSGRVCNASLSLSGCGFLGIYHAGVCAAIKEYVPQLLQNQISGASAGSIIAAGIVCDVCISQATSLFLSVVSEARSYTFGVLNRDFDLMKLVRVKLNAILPSNAHELCTGRLRISVTRFSDMENIILDEFRTKDELVDAICCSCFIPVYGGFVYPTFRDEIYIDGGATDNQPVIDVDTITVSPFSGESDICPTDGESASLFEWNFAGTSIRLTSNNLYRAALCLFPPSTEECASICRSGFNDALKFIIANGFTSNAVFLSAKTDLSVNFNQINEALDAAVSSSTPARERQKSYDDKKIVSCADTICSAESTHPIQSVFNEAIKKRFLNYIRSFRVVQLAHSMTVPLTAAYEWFRFCQCLTTWLATRITRRIADDWHSMKLKRIVDFILDEIYAQEAKVSSRLGQHLAITEVGLQPIVGEQLNINILSGAIEEKKTLISVDELLLESGSSSVKGNFEIVFPLENKFAKKQNRLEGDRTFKSNY